MFAGGRAAAAGVLALDDEAPEDVAALAIAAPPIAAAPTAALVMSTDRMFLMSLLCRLVCEDAADRARRL
jgi:hypothetical protein